MKLENVLCELCGSEQTSEIYFKDGLPVVKCKRCDLIYTNPRLSNDDTVEHYSEDYFQSWFKSSRIDIKKRFRKRLNEINKLKARGKLLDIGCGPGFFLDMAKKEGWDTSGVEYSAFASDYANRELGLKVFSGELQEDTFGEKSFDVITMWHVLEHSKKPGVLLGLASSLLRDDGLLALEVPNSGSFILTLLKGKWDLLAPKEHLFYFTPRTLELFFNSAGLKIVDRRTYFWTSPDMIILKLLGVEGKSGIVNKLIRGLVYPLSIIRFKRLPGWINGDVMIVYATKNTGATS